MSQLENLFAPGRIRTFTGRYVDPLNLRADDICIEDIAHALSFIPRFGGHLPVFLSVAKHSVHCCSLVEREHRLAALLHDASEAYLLDVPSPVKERIPGYRQAEEHIMQTVADRYGFQWPLSAAVKEADRSALHYEWNKYVINEELVARGYNSDPKIWKYIFLRRFKRYCL